MIPKPRTTPYSGSGKLKELKTFITGGNSGIGLAVAYAFFKEVADVLIVLLEADPDIDATSQTLHKTTDRKSVCIKGDVCDEVFFKVAIEK